MSVNDEAEGAPKALESLQRLRSRLEVENPLFRAASILERRTDAFLERLRADLKSRRKRLHWDQQELGSRVGYSQSAISKLESGQAELTLKALYRMADAMGVRPVIAFVPAVRLHATLPEAVTANEAAHPEDAARAEEMMRAIEEAQTAMIRHVAQGLAPMTELAAAAADEVSEQSVAVAAVG